jgi:hypothetical protein
MCLPIKTREGLMQTSVEAVILQVAYGCPSAYCERGADAGSTCVRLRKYESTE